MPIVLLICNTNLSITEEKKRKKKRGVKSKLDSDETNLCCKKLVNFCHFPGPWDDASYSERRSSRTCRQYFVLWPPYLYASWIRRYLDHTCTLGKRCLHILSKMENKQMLKYSKLSANRASSTPNPIHEEYTGLLLLFISKTDFFFFFCITDK